MNNSYKTQDEVGPLETSDSNKEHELIVKSIEGYKKEEKSCKISIAVTSTLYLFLLSFNILVSYAGFSNKTNVSFEDPLATSLAMVIGNTFFTLISAYHVIPSVYNLKEKKRNRKELEIKLNKINEEKELKLTPKKR